MLIGDGGPQYGEDGGTYSYIEGLVGSMDLMRERILSQNPNIGPVIAPYDGPRFEMTAEQINQIMEGIANGAPIIPDFGQAQGVEIAAAEAAAEAAICLV